MKTVLFFIIAFFTTALFAESEDERAAKRIHAHLLLSDTHSAIQDAKQYIALFPDSKAIQLALMRAFCECGDEMEALDAWTSLNALSEELSKDRSSLEMLAWSVLNKGETSNQLIIRLNALIGASLTRDAKALRLLIQELRGTNALLRATAISLASQFGDIPLQAEIERLLKDEKIWYVRLEVIKAIGKLHMTQCRTQLKEIIGNAKTLMEEKVASIIALVNMYESIDERELQGLTKSNRAGLRELACEIVSHLDMKEKAKQMSFLLKDSHPHVRMAMLNAYGLLGITEIEGKSIQEYVKPLMQDPIAEVSVTACWVNYINGGMESENIFSDWVLNADISIQRLASAALSATGKRGVHLLKKLLDQASDPYVKVNLALGLIGQRSHVNEACQVLYHVFFEEKHVLWMWDNQLNPLFRSLSPSRIRHTEQIPNYPMVVDQLTRLDILSVLSIMNFPKALDAIKEYLQNPTWGITGAAAIALLQEGDENALELIRVLLDDPEEKIRLQAALILALIGSDPAALKVLQEVYPRTEREMKVHILEALGKIGDPSIIPFLLKILHEPFQILRVVAASAIIQCLYH